jgi:hypothetical protein
MATAKKRQSLKKRVKDDPLNESTMELVWNNPSDEKASEFYKKKYLRGRKDDGQSQSQK